MNTYQKIRVYVSKYLKNNNSFFGKNVRLFLSKKREKQRKKQNELFKKVHFELLSSFSAAMKELELPYWLDFGTLLGLIRDGSYIEHDTDTDFGMFLKDYSPLIVSVLEKYGFKKIKEFQIDGGKYGREIVFSYKGIHADIFFYSIDKQTNEMYTHISFVPESFHFYEMQERFGGLRPIEIKQPYMNPKFIDYKGIIISIPEKEDEYLQSCYGPQYMIKDPNYRYESFKSTNRRILENKVSVLIEK